MSQDLYVFKFGGAALQNAAGIRRVADILQSFAAQQRTLVVVSAMGKTTNALEAIVEAYFRQDDTAFTLLHTLRETHYAEMRQLFDPKIDTDVFHAVNDVFVEAEWVIEDEPHDAFDYVYDQLVSIGELISSKILAAYLQKINAAAHWLDARDVLKTDETWRESVIRWDETRMAAQAVLPMLGEGQIVVTQGFIGATADNNTTTFGREGSDFSAAVFANLFDAKAMSIWKDVKGVLTGDPRIFDDMTQLLRISYAEATEMTYYGATVVHPRTIAPLVQKNIPLHVRSFMDLSAEGTIIGGADAPTDYPPIFMVEKNQLLLQIANLDHTFLFESQLSEILTAAASSHVFVNLLQITGACLYLSVTNDATKIAPMLNTLTEKYRVTQTTGLTLFTIRHPNASALERIKKGQKIWFEVQIPHTVQVLCEA